MKKIIVTLLGILSLAAVVQAQEATYFIYNDETRRKYEVPFEILGTDRYAPTVAIATNTSVIVTLSTDTTISVTSATLVAGTSVIESMPTGISSFTLTTVSVSTITPVLITSGITLPGYDLKFTIIDNQSTDNYYWGPTSGITAVQGSGLLIEAGAREYVAFPKTIPLYLISDGTAASNSAIGHSGVEE